MQRWTQAALRAIGWGSQSTPVGKDEIDPNTLETSDPKVCIEWMQTHHPTLKNYARLKKHIQTANQDANWMHMFLELDGLDILLQVLEKLSDTRRNILNASLQVEIVGCIKAVMNSKVGLDFIVDHDYFTRKLAGGK